jgi:hypothetical protein
VSLAPGAHTRPLSLELESWAEAVSIKSVGPTSLTLRAEAAGYSDEKVANREIRGLALRDREWLLNDGQIQTPSVQI